MDVAARFADSFAALAEVGRDPAGGWTRLAFTPEDAAATAWFDAEAARLALSVERDRNGNLWAWWGKARPFTIAVGSHLDTVRRGGAYDGALGVVSALIAVELLQSRGVSPHRPVAVVGFAEEEGARFGVPTLGSRLLAGAIDVGQVQTRIDGDGISVGDAAATVGCAPGPDPERLALLGCFLELHVEQGRALVDLDAPVAVATGIWPHGRWRLALAGEGNHAGTTRLADRCDPMLPLAHAVLAARRVAGELGCVATVGRVLVEPNGTNSVPTTVTAWLDARAADDVVLDDFLVRWAAFVSEAAVAESVGCQVLEESRSAAVSFDPDLADRIAAVLARRQLPVVRLATAAGHDAGVLAAAVPTGMLFVRNPTGVSHSSTEGASDADCVTGIEVLADVIEDLACR